MDIAFVKDFQPTPPLNPNAEVPCNVKTCPREGLPNHQRVGLFSGVKVQFYYCPFHEAKDHLYCTSGLSYGDWHAKHAEEFRTMWLRIYPEDADVIEADRMQHAEYARNK